MSRSLREDRFNLMGEHHKMHEMNLTPGAIMGLFVSHRAAQPKGIEQIRAALDAEKWFFGDSPLVELKETETTDEEGKRIKGARIETTSKEGRVLRVEKHVYEWLKTSLKSAIDDGKVFGFGARAGQAGLGFASEAHLGIEGAKEVEAAKEAPSSPRVVEGKKKAAGA